jgi:hypothetical protein
MMPKEMIIYLVGCFSIIGILNYKYLQQYNRLMAYIEKFHPDIYEDVRQKPDIAGIGYSKGYNRVEPLIKLSERVHAVNDSRLERALFLFIKFNRDFAIASSIAVVLMMIVGLILGLYLQQNSR